MQPTESQEKRVLGLAREIALMETKQIFAGDDMLEKVYVDEDPDARKFTRRAKKVYNDYLGIWTKRLTEIIEVE